MNAQAVSWRRAVAVLAATLTAVVGIVVVTRSDGLPALDATAARATHWFVHRPTGGIVLVDGYAGRSLARIDTDTPGLGLSVAEGRSGAYVLDSRTAQARPIDTAGLVLGPRTAVATLETDSVAGVGTAGLVVVDPARDQGSVVSPQGDAVPFAVPATRQSLIAPDGAVWTVDGDDVVRTTSVGSTTIRVVPNVELTLAGNDAVMFDRGGRRVRFDDGGWVPLPDGPDESQLVLQEPGVPSECAWVGGGDQLWCIGRDGIVDRGVVPGLALTAIDRFAVTDRIGVVVRGGRPEILRFDPVGKELLDDDAPASPPPTADLEISVTSGLVFVDDVAGSNVWAVSAWRVAAIDKDDDATFQVDEDGIVLDEGAASGSGEGEVTIGPDGAPGTLDRPPDENGIDDPPVANDDPVAARAGSNVQVVVTANDYDPDGEAIAVVAVGDPGRGSADIGNASTVTYQPEPGYVGVDEFRYTIADGNGTTAEAVVKVQLLPPDTVNQAPNATADVAETKADAEVVVDVLANDTDPERDALRIASFTEPDIGGDVREVPGPSGLPALVYDPQDDVEGTATFTYRPEDALGAVGEPATVTVEIAPLDAPNRAPLARPDAVRIRPNVATAIPVLANDRDPDNDRLQLAVPFRPRGLDVRVVGDELEVTALAGAAATVPFSYTITDDEGATATGSVLVVVVRDEQNRPPLVTADTATAVVGRQPTIDVLANDIDPDDDPLVIVGVTQPASGGAQVSIVDGRRLRFVAAALPPGEDEPVTMRFTYTVSDGMGHEVPGDVSVRVLPEDIARVPFARDDAATTFVDVPVTIDVLRNDGDPSGDRPLLTHDPSCPTGGTATRTADGRVTFLPPPGRWGVYLCTYEVANDQGAIASATIVITVERPTGNRRPEVDDQPAVIDVGATRTFDLLRTATDADGDELRVISSTRPTEGTADRQGSLLTYTAPATPAQVTITFQVGDTAGAVATASLLISVQRPEQRPPTADPIVLTSDVPGADVRFDVSGSVSDPDGLTEGLRITGLSVDGATATVTGARTVLIRPPADFVGVITGTYQVTDGDGLSAASTIRLTVRRPPNRPPVASADAAQVENGGTVTVDVLQNDVDLDSQPLSLAIVAGAEQRLGSAVVRDRAIRFTAAPGESGTATIRYEISDGEASAQADLVITVLPCPESFPSAADATLQTGYMQPITVDLTQYASNGQVVDVNPPLDGGTIGTITPAAGENGLITITYAVRNSCRQRDTGTIVIDVNQEPIGRPYAISIGRREQRTVPVTDLASDGEPLRIVSLAGAPGWASITGDGTALALVPNGAASGTSTFDAVIEDPGGLRVVVTITVEVTNRAPIAVGDTVDASAGRTVFDPLANDSDPDGDPISLLSVPDTVVLSDGSEATLRAMSDGTIEVNPAGNGGGTGTFQYTIRDDLGLVSAPATVTVRVNRAPFARNVTAVLEAGSTTVVALDAGDPDGDALTVSLSGVPAELSVVVVGLALQITVPSDPGSFTYEFDYIVSDPFGGSASARVQLAVLPGSSTTTTTTTPPPDTTTTTNPPGPPGRPPGGPGPPGSRPD